MKILELILELIKEPSVIIITSAFTAYVTYILALKLSLQNKQKEIRLNYLIESYRRIAMAVQRQPEKNSPYFRDLEIAVVDIQLFGTEAQIKAIIEFLEEWKQDNRGDLNTTLTSLRDSLRDELKLKISKESIRYFRPEGAPIPENSEK